jgi:hypothetical protein
MRTMGELTIVVDARYLRPLGYGGVWRATVRAILEGELADRDLRLTVFNDLGGRMHAGRFQHDRETAVRLRLRSLPERPAALEGFVADDGTVWELVAVER